MKNNTNTTSTTVSIANPGKYGEVAASTAKIAAQVIRLGKRASSLADEIAPTIRLAYTTGYVFDAKGMSKDDKAAAVLAGQISQTDYVKSFAGADADSAGPSVTTIKRWRRLGEAQYAGLDVKSPAYRWLKVSDNATKVAALLDGGKADKDSLLAAIESAKTTVVPAKGTTTDTEASEDTDTRAPQVPEMVGTQAEVVEVLLRAVGAVKMDSTTPDEYSKIMAAFTALAGKIEAYDASVDVDAAAALTA